MELNEPQEWGPAEVPYPDFKGTAQLDYKITGESGFSQAGIDENKWRVVGFDLGGGEQSHDAVVIAIDEDLISEAGGLEQLKEQRGYIPVTELHLHEVEAYELLKSITHVFDLRMLRRHMNHRDIRVVSAEDIPPQD